MSSFMNTRLKNFVGGSKRRSSSNLIATSSSVHSRDSGDNVANVSNTNLTPQQSQSQLGASTSSPRSGQSSPPPSTSTNANSSNSSLPMNSNNPSLGRPPSYTYANQGGAPPPGGLGGPQPHGRPSSPLPPPPINTQQPYSGHPPQQTYGQHPPPPAAGPPGYPVQQQAPSGYATAYGQQQSVAAYRGGHVAEVEGSQRSKAQLIVGIDFGTTFSGVAFAFATNTEAKEDIITEWPGAGNQTKQKIPTVLYYDQNQQVVGWGPDISEALAPTGYPKTGVQKVEWFKLQLMLSGNTYIDPINLPPLPP